MPIRLGWTLYQDVRRFLPHEETGSHFSAARSILRGVLSPGFRAVAVFRFFNWASSNHLPTQPMRYFVERWVEVTTGISIPAGASIGPGLRIHHFGAIHMHPSVRLGRGCTLYHDVTIGTNGLTEDAPVLGDDVLLGAGCRVLGPITLGDRTKVGANAVVVHSCPPDSILVGVPATRRDKHPKAD